MADANPTAKAQAEIPYGIIEYTATFKNPILEAWSNPAGLIRAVLSALDSFGFKLEGVEYKIQAEKINERAIVFRRTPPGAVLTVGPGKLLISAENLDWSEAERFISGMNAAMSAIHEVSKYEIASQQLALGMHVQFKAKTQTDVSAPLLSPMALKLMDGEVKSYGIILNRDKSSILIDGSAAFANALFVRMVREHAGEIPLQEVAGRLHKDEETLFDVLGIEGVL